MYIDSAWNLRSHCTVSSPYCLTIVSSRKSPVNPANLHDERSHRFAKDMYKSYWFHVGMLRWYGCTIALGFRNWETRWSWIQQENVTPGESGGVHTFCSEPKEGDCNFSHSWCYRQDPLSFTWSKTFLASSFNADSSIVNESWFQSGFPCCRIPKLCFTPQIWYVQIVMFFVLGCELLTNPCLACHFVPPDSFLWSGKHRNPSCRFWNVHGKVDGSMSLD